MPKALSEARVRRASRRYSGCTTLPLASSGVISLWKVICEEGDCSCHHDRGSELRHMRAEARFPWKTMVGLLVIATGLELVLSGRAARSETCTLSPHHAGMIFPVARV